MYGTEVIWWAFTAYVGIVTLFMLWFTSRVRERGD